MGESLIVRKGGGGKQALAPTITEVSTTEKSITFTITNNDASTAVILYELDDATPDANSIELAASETSGSITVSDLASETAFDVYATANVTGKVKSNVTELKISTDAFIFTEATGGTIAEYDDGGSRFRSHTFTSSGDFIVNGVGEINNDRNQVDYLIIAGGGGGSFHSVHYGGGGGAGGYRTTNGTSGANSLAESKVVVTATTFPIIIGAGGAGRNTNGSGNDGVNSSALGITSTGGGGGGGDANGRNGGSGGGGSGGTTGVLRIGGVGTANQGSNGGDGAPPSGTNADRRSGGGGGAGQVGGTATSSVTGVGGNGLANTLQDGNSQTRGIGGNGTQNGGIGSAGTANTGNGGGGAQQTTSGSGGSGLVVIRYEIAPSV